MKLTFSIFCAAFVLAILATGCAKPPTEEMNNAIEAVTRAENDIDAVTYAGNSIGRARDALASMRAEADSKRYDAAKAYAIEATAAAERAISEGRAGAERARSEAVSLVSQLRPLIADTEQGLKAAEAARLALDFDALERELDNAIYNTNEAQASINGGRYANALERGRTARIGLNNINQQLSNATLSISRKK
jgi:hydrogenase maturation factor HypF (carbamoyltransferase family)